MGIVQTTPHRERIGYRPKEFKALTGISLSSISRLMRSGRIPYVEVGNKMKLIPADAVSAWLSHHAGGTVR